MGRRATESKGVFIVDGGGVTWVARLLPWLLAYGKFAEQGETPEWFAEFAELLAILNLQGKPLLLRLDSVTATWRFVVP